MFGLSYFSPPTPFHSHLSSFGHDAIAQCEWCSSFEDFALYSLPAVLLGYLREAGVIGVGPCISEEITSRVDSEDTTDINIKFLGTWIFTAFGHRIPRHRMSDWTILDCHITHFRRYRLAYLDGMFLLLSIWTKQVLTWVFSVSFMINFWDTVIYFSCYSHSSSTSYLRFRFLSQYCRTSCHRLSRWLPNKSKTITQQHFAHLNI